MRGLITKVVVGARNFEENLLRAKNLQTEHPFLSVYRRPPRFSQAQKTTKLYQMIPESYLSDDVLWL